MQIRVGVVNAKRQILRISSANVLTVTSWGMCWGHLLMSWRSELGSLDN